MYQGGEGWYQKKIYMVKNLNIIKHGDVNGDVDSFVILDKQTSIEKLQIVYNSLDDLPYPKVIDTPVTSYHYGWCRNDAIFMIKRYYQEIQWNGIGH